MHLMTKLSNCVQHAAADTALPLTVSASETETNPHIFLHHEQNAWSEISVGIINYNDLWSTTTSVIYYNYNYDDNKDYYYYYQRRTFRDCCSRVFSQAGLARCSFPAYQYCKTTEEVLPMIYYIMFYHMQNNILHQIPLSDYMQTCWSEGKVKVKFTILY